MKLTQLRHLLAIAEFGGLRRAARHLGVAQPAITRSIRDLEHELGLTIFVRSATGMQLTPIGEALVRRCKVVQTELDRAVDEVLQLKGQGAGTVSVGLSTAPHVSLLPRVLDPFRRRYPNARLEITEGLFPAMEADIRNGTIDFYIGPLSENQSGGEMAIEKLFDNRRVVMARPGHHLAAARSLSDLVGANWVATSVTSNSDAELKPIFDAAGLPPPHISVQAHSGLSMITVAASSDLLALLPQQWLVFAKQTRLLSHIRLDEKLEAPAICLVRRASLPLTPIAEHLADLFRRIAYNLKPDVDA